MQPLCRLASIRGAQSVPTAPITPDRSRYESQNREDPASHVRLPFPSHAGDIDLDANWPAWVFTWTVLGSGRGNGHLPPPSSPPAQSRVRPFDRPGSWSAWRTSSLSPCLAQRWILYRSAPSNATGPARRILRPLTPVPGDSFRPYVYISAMCLIQGMWLRDLEISASEPQSSTEGGSRSRGSE
jgi:hypothetical protein